jgi:DNA-binding transcriptional regulator LsrR (DeoR family)
MGNEADDDNVIFSRITNVVLAIATSAVLAIASLFFQNQLTTTKIETKLGLLETTVSEVKENAKENGRILGAQMQSIDNRLRYVEQKR